MSNNVIVLDTGSYSIKSGWSSTNVTPTETPSVLGQPTKASGMSPQQYIGPEVMCKQGLLNLSYPLRENTPFDKDSLHLLWSHVYEKVLMTNSREHPLLVVLPSNMSAKEKDAAFEILFESLEIPSVELATAPILTLYGVGSYSGVIVHLGESKSHVTTIWDGAQSQARHTSNVAGLELTRFMTYLIALETGMMLRGGNVDIARQIKEEMCYCHIPLDTERADRNRLARTRTFELPDGTCLRLGQSQINCPEALFYPYLVNSEDPGIHQLILQSLEESDIHLRRQMLCSIIVSGGCANIAGLKKKLAVEISRRTISSINCFIKIFVPEQPQFTVWKGGAILSQLMSPCQWLTKSAYEEMAITPVPLSANVR